MKQLMLWCLVLVTSSVTAQNGYFPPAGSWELRAPSESGIDSSKLNAAIAFAESHETKMPRDAKMAQAMTFGNEPFDDAIGPLADRAGPTGLIVYKGYIVGSWGEPSKVDMTNSVTKSFLSTLIGLAVDHGLIRSIDDKVADYMPPIEWSGPNNPGEGQYPHLIFPFLTKHNQLLNWDVMLRQTSDWEGELWGKPDWADRPGPDQSQWLTRKRNAPGEVWQYNDVRVNALALAATCVWRLPLPQVLRQYIMDPIGASGTWRWYGYRNSWIVLDGSLVQSVSGGGHWGGGMFINAYDMARFGLLSLHRGNWKGKQLIPEDWIRKSLTPTTVEPTYGFMNYFLNTGKKYLPSAPASAFAHVGNGTNIIYLDPDHQLVMVARWIESSEVDQLVKMVLESLK